AFVLFGILIRLGNMKQVYWKSRRSMFGYIPLGLVFLLVGYYTSFSEQAAYVFYAYIAALVVLIVFTLYVSSRPPEFIKPTWIKWVEKYPNRIQKAMRIEADVDDEWKQRVTSEAAVDAWAKELARKLPKKK
ncbi:MAG TPA: hypothetical protein VMC62_06345, partial [Longilinea sp.]|nr:hypothetical protein [Longilinea sp.]